ncbi:hypothetical protein [Pseudosulfitobacter pseudonitzschiae]|uniref:hypothetical protein n=1 Tax=Pseudosulfitobacter pseudonitzschiae TaxID=1402135 RepID=UPI003B7DBCD5
MSRTITKIEASASFWKDLEGVRKESWYGQLRQNIAEFVIEASQGNTSREKGFANPKLKGIMHIRLPQGMRMFHVYPKSDMMRLCLVVDHSSYGFNGKHMGREGKTADKIWRDFEVPAVRSPFWDDVRWKQPEDILRNPEVDEMSSAGLSGLMQEIDEESRTLVKLMRATGAKTINDIPEECYDKWAEDLIEALDRVAEAIENMARRRNSTLEINDFEPWMGI